jgi:hypothetical protein
LKNVWIELWVGKLAREVADEFTAKKSRQTLFCSGFHRSYK